MIILDHKQRSPAWLRARTGLPTASKAGRLITPAKYAPVSGKAARAFLAEMLAECVIEAPCDSVDSGWMDRGTELEPRALEWYELTRGVDVQAVGLCLNDERTFGFSPDGLVGDDGGVEIKCLSAKHHMRAWLDLDAVYREYRLQVQSSLWASGRAWWDLVFYNPRIDSVVYRATPDPKFAEAFAPVLKTFTTRLAEARERYGLLPPGHPMA